jgi:hypothetical protein
MSFRGGPPQGFFMNALFLIAAVVGITAMVCQFLLSVIGLGHDLGDGVGDSADVPTGFHGDFHGGFHGDVLHTHAAGAEHQGSDADWDDDAHAHHASANWLFGVISFRTLVAATAIFGVAGKAALSAGLNPTRSLALALLAGAAALYGMFWLMKSVAQLSSSGNERIRNAVGRFGTVYIPIPAAGQGAGKVQLSMQNRIVELQAVTDEADRLKTGEAVEVVALTSSDCVQVRRVREPAAAVATQPSSQPLPS